jgi:hypothetical protein
VAYDEGFKRAEGNEEYRDILVFHYDVLTMKYREFIQEKANLRYDEQLFTDYLSEMVTILGLILPKVKGGGKRTEALYDQLVTFEPWISDIIIPRVQERDRVFDLHKLIGEAYEILGLSPI